MQTLIFTFLASYMGAWFLLLSLFAACTIEPASMPNWSSTFRRKMSRPITPSSTLLRLKTVVEKRQTFGESDSAKLISDK